jgi:uncharacterized surface protein with fasciclin (FAS1) repeats
LPVIPPAIKLKKMSNIVQVINAEKNMTVLKKSVMASGLSNVLTGTGPFTVFAPSDSAFEKLQNGVVESLLRPENKARLADMLNDHIVAGKVNFKDLKDGANLKTLNGKQLHVSVKDGHVSVQGAEVLNYDRSSSNGVLHSLDAVIIRN